MSSFNSYCALIHDIFILESQKGIDISVVAADLCVS